ncbi:MAG: hypothetical protein GY778_16055 [bacterium]|nr:hypothetical protein [bacterium]
MVDQYSEEFELGPGITAIIGLDVSLREFGRIGFFQEHWVNTAPTGEGGLRTLMLAPLCCIRAVEGFPDGQEWARLPSSLTPSCEEFEANARLLMHDRVSARRLSVLTEVISGKMTMTDDDKKK